ncbi:MAG: hypothetical protein MK101_04845 [Phycisphaerales bacterium]|nr:hypothetical protein [Phycisphaerales bacterium]
MLHDPLPDQHRLWEGRLLSGADGDSWRLALKVHHAIADGRSMASLLNQWVREAAALLRAETEERPSLALELPAEQRVRPLMPRETWVAQMEAAGEVELTPWPLDREASIASRRPRVAFRSMSGTASQALLEACRREKTTVLGAFAAALAAAQARHAGTSITTDVLVPFDLRRWFAAVPDPDELQMGVNCTGIPLQDVSPNIDPWTVAREFRENLDPFLGEAGMPPVDFMPEDITGSSGEWASNGTHYRHGSCISNVGVLPFSGDHPPLICDSIDMTAAVHFGGLPLLVVPYTHKGRMRINITWTEPLMSNATAAIWIDLIWSILHELAGVKMPDAATV